MIKNFGVKLVQNVCRFMCDVPAVKRIPGKLDMKVKVTLCVRDMLDLPQASQAQNLAFGS